MTDVFTGMIQKYTLDGVYLGGWKVAGTPSTDPYGVATDLTGRVYVANWSAGPILIYDTIGQPLGTIGAGGSGPGQFFRPHGITIDPGGNLLVADTDNQRVQKLSSSGSPLWSFGSPGTGPGQFRFPVDVTLDAAGQIYVTDYLNHRIQVFGAGITPTRIAIWGRIKAAYR